MNVRYRHGLWATKSENVRLIVLAISSKVSNLCDPDPSTSQTDGQRNGQADGRHSASHSKNYVTMFDNFTKY